MESLIIEIGGIVFPVACVVICVLLSYGVKWIGENVNNKKVKDAFNVLGDITQNVVTSLNQTMAVDIKTSSKDGKLTKEEKLMLKTKAMSEIKKTLKKEIIASLKGKVDLDTLISHNIEAEVKWQKS